MQKLLLLICLAFLSNCKNHDVYDQQLKKIVKPASLKEAEKIIVIPRAGCGGCINEATIYAVTHYKKLHRVIFILTAVDDYKRIKYTLGEDFLNNHNVIIDSNKLLQSGQLHSNYPYVLKLSNKKVISKKDFTGGDFPN
jgi:hypothetical protein